MLKAWLLIFFASVSLTTLAQPADSLWQASPVKTLSNMEYQSLLKGRDQYHMSLVADLNGFPSAQKAPKYKKELDLSPAQVGAITKIDTELNRKKMEMGGFIIRNETKLDDLFRAKNLTEGDILFYGNRSGLYYGELRNAILMAAYKTYSLLALQQVNKLKEYKNDN